MVPLDFGSAETCYVPVVRQLGWSIITWQMKKLGVGTAYLAKFTVRDGMRVTAGDKLN